MEPCVLVFVLLLFHLQNHRTNQKLSLPTSLLQDNSRTHEECLERVLLRSHAKHVRLVCGSSASYCPSTIKKYDSMSWMFFNRNFPEEIFDRRHFCVLAGDNISHLHDAFLSDHNCSNEKVILAFPSATSSKSLPLEKLFLAAWEGGIMDIVVVVSSLLCRAFTYVPIREHRSSCPDVNPVLITSWAKDSHAPNNDSSAVFFRENKITSLHLCEIQVLVKSGVRKFWAPVLDFLRTAMNATFSVTLTDELPNLSLRLRPSEIQISPLIVHEHLAVEVIIPAFLFYEENIFAVPRAPTSSLQWYRLFSELSSYVWYGLIAAMVMMTGILYYLIHDVRDFALVVFFVLQPLLGTPGRGNFLCWRGQILFISWLMFCFFLQSSYLCTFLSELTVPSTTDALKSFDDLLNSVLPIHVAFDISAVNLQIEPVQLKALMSKIHQSFDGSFHAMVKKDRRDIAYLVPKYLFDIVFSKMPYRVLPGISINNELVPFRLNKPSPYGRFFEIAFMRALGAGAVEKVYRNLRLREDYRYFTRRQGGPPVEKRPKPVSLKTFGVLLSAWLIGCVLGIISFVAEICLNCNIAISGASVLTPTPKVIYIRRHQ